MIKKTTEEENRALDGRVWQLEGAVNSLVHEVEATSKSVKEIAFGMGQFREDVLAELSKASTPKWPLIIGIGSILFTMLGLAGTVIALIISGQRELIAINTSTIADMKKTDISSSFEDGRNSEWKHHVDREIIALDVKLQKEMNLINETANIKISGLDEKLQREMRLLNETNLLRTSILDTNIIDLKAWRLKHTEVDANSWGTTMAKLEHLLDQTKQLESRQFQDRIDRMNNAKTKGNDTLP